MKNKIWELFITFLKIGAFTFGGGYAMIPIIEKEVIDKKKWLDEEELLDILVIAESTPGPVSINSSTYIGYKVAGFWGAFFATLGVVLPSLIIVSLISVYIVRFQNNEIIQMIFQGVRAGVVVLIFNAAFGLTKRMSKDIFTIFIFLLIFIATFVFKASAILMMMLSAVLGIIYGFIIINKRLSKEEIKDEDND